jgi:hypothetical protein
MFLRSKRNLLASAWGPALGVVAVVAGGSLCTLPATAETAAPQAAGAAELAAEPGGFGFVAGQPDANATGEEVILDVYLRRQSKLSGGIVAYVEGDDLLVPLDELMILLEFAIKSTPTGATGWFVAESRRFELDVQAGTVLADGQRYDVPKGSAKRIDGELYVSARGLTQWLPLNLQASLRAMTLNISPREQTPMEARAQRDKKKFGSIHQFRSQLPKQATPYALAQIPSMEFDGAIGTSTRDEGNVPTSGSLRLFGDFLFMNGELFVTGNDGGVSDARVRLGRVDPDGGLLGPLNATEFALGDVSAPAVPLVSSGLAGRGVTVTSRPQSYIAEFDRITIEDSVPVGYEVELYRNNILMASSGPSSTGRFRFDDVSLLRGSNEIRLEFYGPQGQRRTDVKQYFVGNSQLPVGKLNYDLSLSEQGESVFGFTNWVRDRQEFTDSAFGGVARVDYGLTRNMSVSAGLVGAPIVDLDRKAFTEDYRVYGTLGARTMVGDISLGTDLAVEDQGGVAAGVNAQTALGGWNFSGRHEQYLNEFQSTASYERNRDLGRYAYRTSQSSLRADTGGAWLPSMYFNFGLSGDYSTFEDDVESWSAGVSTGVSAWSVALSNDLRYGGSLSDQGFYGSALASVRLTDGVSFRASADYDLRDDTDLTGFGVGLSALMPYDVTLALAYSQRYDRFSDFGNEESYSASLKRTFDMVDLGLVVSYNQYDDDTTVKDAREDDMRVSLTASFDTFTDPATLRTRMSSEAIARQGAIRPRAFADTNKNGMRDPGEPLIDKAKVAFAAQRNPHYTDGQEQGALMGPVGAGGWTDVALDPTGIPDASLSPGSVGTAVLPRPGVVAQVDLPVVAKAGLEGRAILRTGMAERPLPNVTVQVVSMVGQDAGTVVVEVTTEYDGAFALASIPVGDYVVRIEPEQARQIGAERPVEQQISLTPETGVLENLMLELTRS